MDVKCLNEPQTCRNTIDPELYYAKLPYILSIDHTSHTMGGCSCLRECLNAAHTDSLFTDF